MLEKQDFDLITAAIIGNCTEEYIVNKTIEELTELNLELIQYSTKRRRIKEKGFSTDRVAEETAHVLIRLHALIRHFDLIARVKEEYAKKGAYIIRKINQQADDKIFDNGK